MAWWNDIVTLLRTEWAAQTGMPAAEPASMQQAQDLLRRSASELASAQAQAEAARRRMLRARAQLEALTQSLSRGDAYQARLLELAQAISADAALQHSFDAHIAVLEKHHALVKTQLRRFDRDREMAKQAQTVLRSTQQADPPKAKRRPGARAGFSRADHSSALDELGKLSRKRDDEQS